MSSKSPFAVDHIIILVPSNALDSLPKAFTDAFTITPGGTHADGKTYNKLVVLASGVYLELIAFAGDDEQRRNGHWWGRKQPGTIIDWALTSWNVDDLSKLVAEGGYDKPRAGGRKRDDGKTVEWYVTFPKASVERGSVPFFCHDATPRELRVPAEGIKHPSGAVGVKSLVVVAAKDKLTYLSKAYTAIFGVPTEEDHRTTWRVREPSLVQSVGWQDSTIVLQEATNQEDQRLVRENGGVAGVKEISLLCDDQDTRHDDVEVVLNERSIRIKLEYQ